VDTSGEADSVDVQMIARNFAQIRQKLQETNNLLEEYKKYYEAQ